MADITTTAPSIESVSWNTNGSVHIVWENHAATGATYTSIEVSARLATSGSRIAIATISGSAINTKTADIASNSAIVWNVGADYVITMRAYGPAGWSPLSSPKTLSGLTTARPSISSATRPAAATGQVVFDVSPVAPATLTKTYLYARLEGTSSWSQKNATTSGSQRTIGVPGLDGTKSYEVRVRCSGPAGWSDYSSVQVIDPYYTRPAGVTNLLHSRNSSGHVTLTWAGTSTATGPYSGQRIYRAVGATGQLKLYKTISGSARSWIDTAASPTQSYVYAVEPYSPMGAASSRPERDVPATILRPNAPTAAPSAAYLATDRLSLSWVRNVSAERPYASQKILRRHAGQTTWATIATVSGTATTFTDTPGGNWRLEYAVLPVNAAGEAASSSPTSAWVATTPARPASLTALWSGASTIIVSWPDFSSIGDAIDIEFSTDNSTWQTGVAGRAITSRSWSHVSVSTTVPHYYRLRVRRSDATGTPASSWVYSKVVAALTTPKAPIVARPQTVDAADVIRLEWTHVPVDGTTQTKADVYVQVQGAHARNYTAIVTGSSGFLDVPAGTFLNGDVLNITVRTAGASGTYGPFSAPLVTELWERPVVTITAPAAGAWRSQTLTVTWEAPQGPYSDGATDFVIELLDGSGNLVESQRVAGLLVATFHGLLDQVTYTVRVTGRDSMQWSLPTTVQIATALERPAPPVLTATFRPHVGASTLLRAEPITGLEAQRINVGAMSRWTQTGEGLVSFPDSDAMGRRLDGGAASLAGMGQLIGDVIRVGVDVMSTYGGVSLIVSHGTQTTSVPVGRGWTRVEATLTAAMQGGALQLARSEGGIDLYVRRPVVTIDAQSPDPSTDYFDEYSVADGKTYGLAASDVPFEAVPVSSGGNIPVITTTRVEFWRSVDGGAWETVGDAGPDWTRIDLLPPLTRVAYKARAYGAEGGWAESPAVDVDCTTRDCYLNFGQSWAGIVRGGRILSQSNTGGGRETDVETYGRDVYTAFQAETLTPRVITRTVQLLSDASTYEEWIAALGGVGDVVYREPMGLSLRGAAQLGAWGRETRYKASVAFTVFQTAREVS